MAGPGPEPELCPHCRRPFKRLRAHLPHCKAAPPAPPAPAASPRPAPARASPPAPSPGPGGGRASGARTAPAAAAGSPPAASPQPGTGTGSAPCPAARSRSRAVRDLARSLDLHPEEVAGVPGRLQHGPTVVIEKHRARVVREKEPRSRAGSRGEGTDPGPAPPQQRRKTSQKATGNETRSQGAAASGTASSKVEKSSLKATKALREPPDSTESPGDLAQQQGRDKFTAGEEQVHLEVGLGSKPAVPALHPKNLHLSLTEACGGHGQGTSRNELSSLPRPGDSGAGVSEPVLSLLRAPELALLHTPKIQPPCPSQASGSSASAGATGLEWFPDLYPDSEGLRIFPGKHFHEDVRITEEMPKAGLAQGQQGPLSERPLLEVRLGELHTWIGTCSFSPQGLLGAAQRAWGSYCAKYLHVKQGGPAGISMLLAGYCLLSYGWNYQHFKRHRWRKYH